MGGNSERESGDEAHDAFHEFFSVGAIGDVGSISMDVD